MYGPLQPDDEYEENKDVDQLVSPQVPPSISPAYRSIVLNYYCILAKKKRVHLPYFIITFN